MPKIEAGSIAMRDWQLRSRLQAGQLRQWFERAEDLLAEGDLTDKDQRELMRRIARAHAQALRKTRPPMSLELKQALFSSGDKPEAGYPIIEVDEDAPK